MPLAEGTAADYHETFLPSVAREVIPQIMSLFSRRPFAIVAVLAMLGLDPMLGKVLRAAEEVPRIDYVGRIKPLFQTRCYACHGGLKQMANLRLDTVSLMLAGGDSGPAIVPGNSATSLLVTRITSHAGDERMPPESEGEPLNGQDISLIREWIEAGAPSVPNEQGEVDPRDHWAYRPILAPSVPPIEHQAWVRNPIDAFVARQHASHGVSPQPEASRLTLLRRLTFDLIGLPPTIDEVELCRQDNSPDWYERTVARLIDDSRHGERWARHWMDIWRYSDWWGLGDQLRNSQAHMWHWRDWIVESLNADKPYDEMVRFMLAADEIAPLDFDQLRATGYLARNYFLFNRHQWMDETVEHVGKGFLGLTTNCAKCHDHKYDPISQEDYYRFRAFFEPYHVRLDMIPGEINLARDAQPRVFDGMLETPTYRFVRGQESQPDQSTVIAPGVPRILDFVPLSIIPLDLPREAWQPERRPWVFDSYRTAARQQLDQARVKAQQLSGTIPEGNSDEIRLQRQVAELEVQRARAFAETIERRIAAMKSTWALDDLAGEHPTDSSEDTDLMEQFTTAAQLAARAASLSEQELILAELRLKVAEIELKGFVAQKPEQTGIAQELATARTALEQQEQKLATQRTEPKENYTRLHGAQWTPTRFLNSTQDDPSVTFPRQSTGRRRALANWITDRKNPLTARVAVNHIWTRHFGRPLVPTLFDFGRKGIPPQDPELLDWLATEFIESGWSMKHLHRLMVTSATYRMGSPIAGSSRNFERDADNLGRWHRTPVRLESQAVRDSILSLAGTLNFRQGGPSVPTSEQSASNRRSLYFFHSNNEQNLFLTTFDEALVKECYRREQSIVPQQALALSNSQLVLDAAPLIARRLVEAVGNDDENEFIRKAFRVVLGTEPSDVELRVCQGAWSQWHAMRSDRQNDEARGFANSQLIWVLLNHHDFVVLH